MYDKKALKNLILENTHNMSNLMVLIEKMDKTEKEVIYITYNGIVRLMDKEYIEFMTETLKSLFYRILLYCAYETNMKEN